MLTEIKNIGRYCVTDENRNIVNDASLEKINAEFLKVIKEVVENYQANLGPEILHSIYIRGSIPRGLISSVSDLDTIAITKKKIDDIDLSWIDETEAKLNRKFDCVNGVELSFYYVNDILETNAFSIIPFMIKTHSVCVYGEDLTKQLPDYKADQTLGNEHIVNLKKQILQAKEDLTDNNDIEDIKDCCVWIMKIIIRAGLALVIIEEEVYTRDLYPAYKLFSKHYPQKEMEMRQSLQYALETTSNPEEIIEFLNQFGNWMENKAEEWLRKYNPDKIANMKLS